MLHVFWSKNIWPILYLVGKASNLLFGQQFPFIQYVCRSNGFRPKDVAPILGSGFLVLDESLQSRPPQVVPLGVAEGLQVREVGTQVYINFEETCITGKGRDNIYGTLMCYYFLCYSSILATIGQSAIQITLRNLSELSKQLFK